MFTKAYVLSATEFRELCIGFFELCAEYYESEIEDEELTENMVRGFLVGRFEEFLRDEGISLIVAYIPEERQLIGIHTGEQFVSYVENEYGDLVETVREMV
jgi:hypothetical protein